LWPSLYDGRAIKGKSFEDNAAGVSLDENLKKFKEAQDAGDMSRIVTWS
jgi:nitronate monooxygenase